MINIPQCSLHTYIHTCDTLKYLRRNAFFPYSTPPAVREGGWVRARARCDASLRRGGCNAPLADTQRRAKAASPGARAGSAAYLHAYSSMGKWLMRTNTYSRAPRLAVRRALATPLPYRRQQTTCSGPPRAAASVAGRLSSSMGCMHDVARACGGGGGCRRVRSG